MIPWTFNLTSFMSSGGVLMNLSWASDPLISPQMKNLAACLESKSWICSATLVNLPRNCLVFSPYLCSRCKSIIVFLCRQLLLYSSKNVLPNCSKLQIDLSGRWLNQLRARSMKVIEKSLHINPLVIFSKEILCFNCRRWEIGSDFPWNFSSIGELKFERMVIWKFA